MALSPRVELLVHAPQILPIHVGIDLGGREVRMPQHFLNGAAIGAAFE